MRRSVWSAVALVLLGTEALAFGPPMPTLQRVVASGRAQKIDIVISLDPTCQSMGLSQVNILEPPRSGQIVTTQGREYPNFPSFNTRSRCNTHRVPALVVSYQSAADFRGEDEFTLEFVGPLGVPRRLRYHVEVR